MSLASTRNETLTHAVSYPYIHSEEEHSISFHINNPIEEFRLKNWGGEKEYVVSMMKELREDDIFFDIGSSVGLISITAARLLKKGKVISFEPDPENTMRLKSNYSLNKLTNYQIQNIAVGNEKTVMKLFTAGSNAFSPSLEKVNGIDSSIEVEVDTIDNLLDKGLIPFPTVVKIDIEGAEMMALEGMKSLLRSEKRPRLIFVEIHPLFLPSFNTSEDEIFSFLKQFNFVMTEKIKRDKQILCKLTSNG